MIKQMRTWANDRIVDLERVRPYWFKHHEWYLDFPWFKNHLKDGDKLDTGFIEHNFLTRWACGNTQGVTTGLDLAEWDYPWTSSRFEFLQQDVTRHIPGDYNQVICPSLLEHIGLGYYGDSVSASAERVVAEFARILRPGGSLLLQVPYGRSEHLVYVQGKPFYRIFDAAALSRILVPFTVVERSYTRRSGDRWVHCDVNTANLIDWNTPDAQCVVRVKGATKR
jgi:hypothetical protein